MNKTRRKKVLEIWGNISDLIADLEDVINEEQNAFDNLPESIQNSDKGSEMEDIILKMNDAKDSLDNAYQELLEIGE